MSNLAKAIALIYQRYILPQYNYNFEEASYSRWAARELIAYLNEHSDIPPVLAVENFRNFMNYCSLKGQLCFSVAFSVSEDILNLLL